MEYVKGKTIKSEDLKIKPDAPHEKGATLTLDPNIKPRPVRIPAVSHYIGGTGNIETRPNEPPKPEPVVESKDHELTTVVKKKK
jgi:hypothetical protein